MKTINLLVIVLLHVIQECLTLSANKCLQQGKQCSQDCSQVIFCPSTQTNELTIQDCQSQTTGLYCDKDKLTCTSTVCEEDQESFFCTGPGIFPHPTDCSKYFTCQQNKSIECRCKPEEYFDHRTKTCDKLVTCYEPIICQDPGSCGTFTTGPNTNYFSYICRDVNQSHSPIVFPCEGKFDHHKCTCERVPWQDSLSLESSGCNDAREKCSVQGQTFPAEDNRFYWQCSHDFILIYKQCFTGACYDRDLEGCSFEAC